MVNKSRLLGSAVPFAGLAALCLLPACTGNLIGTAEGGPGMTQGGNGAGGMVSQTGGAAGNTPITQLDCTNHVADPGPTPLQLLSHQQYLNTIKELAGDVPGLDQALGDDVASSAFGLIQADVSQVQLEHYQQAAQIVAGVIVGNQASLDKIAPCATGTAPTDCAKNMVQKFGALAYRAPVTDAADIDRHVQLFSVGAATSYAHGIEMLLQGMLQSPRFLYRVEIGTTEKVSDNAVKLSPYEVATRLS